MNKQQHTADVLHGNHRPRVYQDGAYYIAWLPTKEGPPRPDWAAAQADLCDMMLEAVERHRKGLHAQPRAGYARTRPQWGFHPER